MSILAILLSLIGSEQGTAETGNPLQPFTDEEQIRAVIGTLEDALIHKDEALVIACLSDRISARKLKEVEAFYWKYVANTEAPQGMPLVCLQSVEVEINGDKATATLTAFSYGNGKRIKAKHRIPFKRVDGEWFIDDAEKVSAILKQIGGIEPVPEPLEEEGDSPTEAQPTQTPEAEQ